MIRLLFLTVCLLLSVAGTCRGLEITFKPSVSIDAASVSLVDIADFDDQSDMAQALQTQTVSQAPPPGQENMLQTAEIVRNLTKTLQVPASVLWKGSATVKVYRNGVRIGPEKIQSIIAEFLKKSKSNQPEMEIRFIPATLPLPFMIPVGNVTWTVTPSNPGVLASSSMTLIFSVDGKVRKNIAIFGHIEAMTPVTVAATALQKGSVLTAAQLSLLTRNIAEVSSPCFDTNELVGKKINRSVAEGTVIERAWIDIPPMISRGQTVKIVLNHGDLHLTTEGIANMNGMKDQIIRVQNISSKKMLSCRVTAPGIVEVQ
ncbi:MAG: flagellar basal body P-ring formation chaperone FlgA [Desulfocapsaceae bacterium]|nr:flagellar basal body P-ring formation chaperone FlgA [Desulfocapsaceae bacterium]